LITLENAYVINKINVMILSIILIYGVKFKSIKKTELIVLPCLILGMFSGYYILENSDFYSFYLNAALNSLLIVAVSVFIHNELRVEHSRAVYLIYGLLLFDVLLYMIVYRVRVIIYDSDEPIMWLINAQSFFILTCDFLIISILVIKVSKWKLPFMRFS
jgi:hypothetical protein